MSFVEHERPSQGESAKEAEHRLPRPFYAQGHDGTVFKVQPVSDMSPEQVAQLAEQRMIRTIEFDSAIGVNLEEVETNPRITESQGGHQNKEGTVFTTHAAPIAKEPQAVPSPDEAAAQAREIHRSLSEALARGDSREARRLTDALADRLQQQGVPFEVIPEGVYPGMRYTTPRALLDSELPHYSHRHALSLIREQFVSGFYIAGTAVLGALGVQQLLERQQESEAANAHAGGRMPGRRNKHREGKPHAA